MFSLVSPYSFFMNKNLLWLICPLLLSGCIGSLISGNTGYLEEDYPDIRAVPERKEATTPRGLHTGEEKASRATEMKNLKQDREKIIARDQALREKAFSTP